MPQFRGFQKYAYKKQKPGYYLHDFLNTKNPLVLFRNKRFVLGIVALAVMVGGIVLAQGPLFHSLEPNQIPKTGFANDPFSLIWSESCPNCSTGNPQTIPGWTALLGIGSSVTYGSAAQCSAPVPCFAVGSDTSNTLPITTIARTRNSIGDLSIASAKNLLINMTFRTTQSIMVSGVKWGFYLTTNSSFPPIPPGVAYDPTKDPSVFFVSEFQCITTCNSAGTKTLLDTTYMLRTIGTADTIDNENNGCANFSGSVFDCTTAIFDPALYTHSISSLNFTGSSTPSTTCPGIPPAGSGCSYVAMSQNAGLNYYVYTQVLPWLGINSIQYYLGLYTMPGLDGTTADAVQWQIYQTSNTQSMFFGEYTIPACVASNTCPVSPPQLDTGGFFGPVIRALISIGVVILANIVNFGNYLGGLMGPVWAFLGGLAAIVLNGISSIIITLLNDLGSLIGDPNLGNQLVSVFTQIGSYITTLFSKINSLVSTLITFLVNSFNFLFDVTNGFLTYWIGTVLFGILGVLVTISNIIVTVLKVFQVGFPFVVLADLLWLLSESIDHGTEGAMKWWQPHEILVVNVGKLMFVLVETLSTFIYQTIVEIEGGAADIKPEIAGFSV